MKDEITIKLSRASEQSFERYDTIKRGNLLDYLNKYEQTIVYTKPDNNDNHDVEVMIYDYYVE